MKLQKTSVSILILFLILSACYTYTWAQNKIKTSYEYSNNTIIISYEFRGDSTKEYDVSVILKRTSDPGFSLKPTLLTGDFGKGKFANGKREIVWHLTQQDETNLTGNDYYFEVTANEIKSGAGLPWYVYVGGVILGGGTAAVLLLNKKNESGSASSSSTFPAPPARPNQ